MIIMELLSIDKITNISLEKPNTNRRLRKSKLRLAKWFYLFNSMIERWNRRYKSLQNKLG